MWKIIKIKDAIRGLMLIILLGISVSGFTLQTFILKADIMIYLIIMFTMSLFFATAVKNLKLGLLYLFPAILLGIFLTWLMLILPPLWLGEDALVSFTTEIFAYYIARYILLSLPFVLLGMLIGSIIVNAL